MYKTKKKKKTKKYMVFIVILAIIVYILFVYYGRGSYYSKDPKDLIEYNNLQVEEIFDIIYVDEFALVVYKAKGNELMYATKLLLYENGEYRLLDDIDQFVYMDGNLVLTSYNNEYIIYATVWFSSENSINVMDNESSEFICESQEINQGVYVINCITVLDEIPEDYRMFIDNTKIYLKNNGEVFVENPF